MSSLWNRHVNDKLKYVLPSIFAVTAAEDVCLMGTNNCHINALCTNTDGGFNCSCMTGYDGNGITCAGKIYVEQSNWYHSDCVIIMPWHDQSHQDCQLIFTIFILQWCSCSLWLFPRNCVKVQFVPSDKRCKPSPYASSTTNDTVRMFVMCRLQGYRQNINLSNISCFLNSFDKILFDHCIVE